MFSWCEWGIRLIRFAFLVSVRTRNMGAHFFTGRNDEMKAEVKVENLELNDFSTTYHLFRLENLRGIYYVH